MFKLVFWSKDSPKYKECRSGTPSPCWFSCWIETYDLGTAQVYSLKKSLNSSHSFAASINTFHAFLEIILKCGSFLLKKKLLQTWELKKSIPLHSWLISRRLYIAFKLLKVYSNLRYSGFKWLLIVEKWARCGTKRSHKNVMNKIFTFRGW